MYYINKRYQRLAQETYPDELLDKKMGEVHTADRDAFLSKLANHSRIPLPVRAPLRENHWLRVALESQARNRMKNKLQYYKGNNRAGRARWGRVCEGPS